MIVVFGSLNIDMVMRMKHLPRPAETVLCPSYDLVSGGKGGNQAVAASKGGGDVKLFGKIGDDEFGRLLMNNLRQTNIDLVGVILDKKSATGCAAICVDDKGENMITVASGANASLKEKEVPDFLLGEGTTLLLQMETNAEENWKLIRRAKKFGAKVILNLAPVFNVPEDILSLVDVIVMNQVEAATLGLHLGYEVISPTIVSRRMAATYGNICVVTLGGEGAIASSPHEIWNIKAMDIRPVDTTAAGDAFVGILAHGMDSGLDLPMALRRASVGSGLACMTNGAQSSLPTSEAIDENIGRVATPTKNA